MPEESIERLLSATDAEFAEIELSLDSASSTEYVERVALAKFARSGASQTPLRRRIGLAATVTTMERSSDYIHLLAERAGVGARTLTPSDRSEWFRIGASFVAQNRAICAQMLRFCATGLLSDYGLAAAARERLPGACDTIVDRLSDRHANQGRTESNVHSNMLSLLSPIWHILVSVPKPNSLDFTQNIERLAEGLARDPRLAGHLREQRPEDCRIVVRYLASSASELKELSLHESSFGAVTSLVRDALHIIRGSETQVAESVRRIHEAQIEVDRTDPLVFRAVCDLATFLGPDTEDGRGALKLLIPKPPESKTIVAATAVTPDTTLSAQYPIFKLGGVAVNLSIYFPKKPSGAPQYKLGCIRALRVGRAQTPLARGSAIPALTVE